MDVQTGQLQDHGLTNVQPLSRDVNPATAHPTPIVPGQLSGPTYPGADTAGQQQERLSGYEADVRAAQTRGQDARNAMLAHYEQDILPVGTAYGDPVNIPPVPMNALPPAGTYEYPWPGDEPVPSWVGIPGGPPAP